MYSPVIQSTCIGSVEKAASHVEHSFSGPDSLVSSPCASTCHSYLLSAFEILSVGNNAVYRMFSGVRYMVKAPGPAKDGLGSFPQLPLLFPTDAPQSCISLYTHATTALQVRNDKSPSHRSQRLPSAYRNTSTRLPRAAARLSTSTARRDLRLQSPPSHHVTHTMASTNSSSNVVGVHYRVGKKIGYVGAG